MAIIRIRTAPDPILRQKARKVKFFDNALKKLIEDMRETMHAAPGVGLAAPQVGVPLRVIVIGVPEEEDIVLVNPQIMRKTGERTVNEGCLSIPGYIGEIKRALSVTVKALDRNGREIRIKGEELLAQALEHEIDHLNGVLYIDHLESPSKLRKVEPEEAGAEAAITLES
ncbi:MAG: peptide deformylase [Chloroflexi bacterium]|nr:peptide deformylase [Chloroflexota bacterium]